MKNIPELTSKMSDYLFLNINTENIKKSLNINIADTVELPVLASTIAENVKNGKGVDSIAFSNFMEGMCEVVAIDEEFKYYNDYIKILKAYPNVDKVIKKSVYEHIKNNNTLGAYKLLKALYLLQEDAEVLDRLMYLCDSLVETHKFMKQEMENLIQIAKTTECNKAFYFYDAKLLYANKQYELAEISIDHYIKLTDCKDTNVLSFREEILQENMYKKGRELVDVAPEEALGMLIPLLDTCGDIASIYYYIAVAYRNLNNHEKAIYYLNESLSIDDSLPEVVNELGINYACLEDFETAIKYLRKAFEVTKSVEICTNLIMCYMNINNMEMARTHMEIAKKLDSKDEILIKLDKMLNI